MTNPQVTIAGALAAKLARLDRALVAGEISQTLYDAITSELAAKLARIEHLAADTATDDHPSFVRLAAADLDRKVR